jgi:hypothetical protein
MKEKALQVLLVENNTGDTLVLREDFNKARCGIPITRSASIGV